MRIIRTSIFAAAALLILVLFAAETKAEIRIGVLQFSDESRYNEARSGIVDQLKKDGFGEPAVKYTIENAKGSKARVVEAARKFASAKLDLIFTLGTSATIPIVREIRDIPIVFGLVFDPVEAGIAKDWKSSGNNTTGASARIPLSKLLDKLKEFTLVKRLAVLYTPGEKNSEAQLKELQKLQSQHQIKVIPIILARTEEVDQTMSSVINTVDAIFLTGSSIIGGSVPLIVDMANKAKVVTVSFLDDLVEKGALLGVCVNSYQLGRLAGTKAVKILKGAKPSSIPIEAGKKLDIILNIKTAKAGQFRIPPAFMKTVTKTIE